MLLSSCAICGPGLVRSENQDNLYINGVYRQDTSVNSVYRYGDVVGGAGLYAVADGMGGEKCGEIASLSAVKSMEIARLRGNRISMAQYLLELNAVICNYIQQHGGVRMGSTFAGLSICGHDAEIVNIGDSRVYILSDGVLTQLSRDHTEAQQMVDLGILDLKASHEHPGRHRLTQHLGVFPSELVIEPHSVRMTIRPDDICLLCSDGLTDMLNDEQIKSIMGASGTVEEKANALYNAALQNGGRDNITILLVQANEEVGGISR